MDELAEVIALMRTNDIEEIRIEREADAMKLHLRRPASVAADLSALEMEVLQTEELPPLEVLASDQPSIVTAQVVGRFNVGAKSGGRPLVKVGDTVKQGQTLGTIETLRLFYEVEAPIDGTIAAIKVAEGEAVEYGQQLMTIEPGEPGESGEPAAS
jgi:acetyl-CoA carboxylase biotin carboxyl carrier protein